MFTILRPVTVTDVKKNGQAAVITASEAKSSIETTPTVLVRGYSLKPGVRSSKRKHLPKVCLVDVKGGKKKRTKAKNMVPPSIIVVPRIRQTFRFYCSATLSNVAISILDVLGALGGICSVANTTLKAVSTSFRIVSIDMYLPVGGEGEIQWVTANTDLGPDQATNAQLPSGITVGDVVRSVPPFESAAHDWVNNAATTSDAMFELTSSVAGAVLDLDVEYTLPDKFSASSVTIAAGTLGAFYYLGLNHSGAKNIVQVALPTTT